LTWGRVGVYTVVAVGLWETSWSPQCAGHLSSSLLPIWLRRVNNGQCLPCPTHQLGLGLSDGVVRCRTQVLVGKGLAWVQLNMEVWVA
jgi:hypothetical protein